jgi:hypothetical protein
MSFWEKLLGAGKKPEPARPKPSLPKPRAIVQVGEVPYGIAQRPMPQGSDPDTLLPRQVGAYVREPIAPAGKGAPIYANYRSGAATVFVELGVCDDVQEARAAFETARDESVGESGDAPKVNVEGDDLNCALRVNESGAFITWTRGRYFFSAHAKGGETSLDEFMTAFPY